MKKITLMCIALVGFAFTWNANAQFTESFETEIPATWTVLNIDGSTGWLRENNPVGGAQDGTAVASLTFSSSAHDDHLITPGIAVTAGVNDQLSYYIKSRSSIFLESYEVLLSTTDAVATSFTVVLKASSEAPAAWTPLLFDLSAYTGQTVYVSIHATGTDEFQLFVDNVVNEAIPTCPSPVDLTVSNITTESADLGWTQSGAVTNWDIELGLSGFTPTGTPTIDDTSENPYTASGLSPSSTYQFYVRADCGSGDTSSWTGPFTFTTACDTVTTFPFLESFEGITTGQPNCWTIEGTTTNVNYNFTSFATGYVGRGMRFDSYFNPLGNTSELITPTFDATSLATLQLKFYYKNPTGGNFEVLVSSDNGASYTSLESDLVDQVDWIAKNYDLTAYISSAMKVKFKGTSNYGDGDARVYLDEVLLRAIPSCLEPTGVTATNITTTSVDLSWTAGADEETWEYALLASPSSEPASGTSTDTNSYTATLAPSAAYDFYVRADCTGDDYSSWVKISFSSADITPDCATTPFPADGATGVPVGTITFSWESPTTGPVPTSYNLYAGETPAGDDYGLIGNYTTTSASITLSGFDTPLYWIIKPVNGTAEAVGCPIWTFVTESAPAVPANDNLCDAIGLNLGSPSSGGAYYNTSATLQTGESGGECWFFGDPASESVWFSFVAPTSGEVRITTIYDGGSLTDTQMALYSVTDCTDFSTLTQLACDEDDDTDVDPEAGPRSLIDYTGLTPGETYYVQVDGYDDSTGTFDIGAFDLSTLSVKSFENNSLFTYFPNPVTNTLNLKAQNAIQNVSVYNMLGQEVAKTTPNALNSEVDMSAFQAGAYFVKVTINDATETIRVIKN